jgi:hypothetical protein
MLISGCSVSYDSLSADTASEPYTPTKMEGMDIVTIGDNFEVTIRSDSEYQNLIFQRFQKPLDDFWNANYDRILQSIKTQNPGLTDEKYEQLVKDVFYDTLPFRGTENWLPPKIDFSKYIILGQSAHASGCEPPDYTVQMIKNKKKKELIFKVVLKEYGLCEMFIAKNIWVLVSKNNEAYKIGFEKEIIQN